VSKRINLAESFPITASESEAETRAIARLSLAYRIADQFDAATRPTIDQVIAVLNAQELEQFLAGSFGLIETSIREALDDIGDSSVAMCHALGSLKESLDNVGLTIQDGNKGR
jgi:hypothetical protein